MAKQTVDDLINKLTTLKSALESQLPAITMEYANNAVIIIVSHIHSRGVPGEQYSEQKMLVTQSVFLQKDKFKPDVIANTLGRDDAGKLIKGGKRTKSGNISKRAVKPRFRWIKFPGARKAVPVMTLPGGYKQLRSIQGLQTGFVDLSYTGRMLQNTKALNVKRRDPFFVVAIIGGVNKETKDKLTWNHEHYDDFLEVTDDVAKLINDVPIKRIKTLINQYL